MGKRVRISQGSWQAAKGLPVDLGSVDEFLKQPLPEKGAPPPPPKKPVPKPTAIRTCCRTCRTTGQTPGTGCKRIKVQQPQISPQ